jgi:hypothetical protein
MRNENDLIWEKYIFNELFDKIYTHLNVVGIHADNSKHQYASILQLLNTQLNQTKPTIFAIIVPFITDKGNEIHVTVYNETGDSLVSPNHQPLHASFYATKDKTISLTSKNNEASAVIASVFNILEQFIDAYKNVIASTAQDWLTITKQGIIQFKAISIDIANPFDKAGIAKERERSETKRASLYKVAFDKIIKPKYAYLKLVRINNHDNDYIIKS